MTVAEYHVTRCETCGQTVVHVHDCVCGHSVLVHDLTRGDKRMLARRTRCTRDGCGCARYTLDQEQAR